MKIYLKAILFIFAAQAAFAQNIEIGAKGSLNFSNVSKFDLADAIIGDFNLLSSGGGAIFAEIPLDKNFSFRPEVGYARRGAKLNGLGLGDSFTNWIPNFIKSSVDARLFLDYVEVPLNIKYKFGESGSSNGYVFGGPVLSFLVDEGVRASFFGLGRLNIPLPLNYNKFEFGGQIGAGYQFPISNNVKAFVEGRYQHGFTNIVQKVGILQMPTKNQNFGISAGLSFPLGK